MIREEKKQEHKYIMHTHIVQENEEAMKMLIGLLEDLYQKEWI